MPPRSLISFLAVGALALERFAYYGLRGTFALLFKERGHELAAAETLRQSMEHASTFVTVFVALVAIVLPRPALAALGLLLASTGVALSSFGAESSFESGMWLAFAGSAVFKGVSFSMCAEFVSSQRLRVGLPLVAFSILNVGANFGSALGLSAEPLPFVLAGYGLATLVALASLSWFFVRRDEITSPTATSWSSAVGVALLTLPAACTLWVVLEILFATPVMGEAPPWIFTANSHAVAALSMGLALVVTISPARWLPDVILGSILVGAVALAGLTAAILLGRPSSSGELFGLIGLESVAESALVAVAMATCVAVASPRLAPAMIALFNLMGTASGAVASLSPLVINICAGSLLLLGLGAIAVLFFLRKPLLAPLVPSADAPGG